MAVSKSSLIGCLLFLHCLGVLVTASAGEATEKTLSEPFNRLGYGLLSGRVQWLAMHRDWDLGAPDSDDDAYSSSLALTVNYKTPRYEGFGAGVQFIHAWELDEGGSVDHEKGAGWLLSNDGFTIFNNAFLDYDFSHFGLKETLLRGGRLPLNLDFAPTYAIRQKEQAYEAVVLSTKAVPSLDLSLGHIERYSSWSSRDITPTNIVTYEFIDVEEIERVPYPTSGMQFISATYSGLPGVVLTAYDFYGRDLYNTVGFKASYTLKHGDAFRTVLKFAYSGQRDVGRFSTEGGGEVQSDVFDLAARFEIGKLVVEPGYFTVAGDEAENDYRVPFRTTFTVDPLLMWFARVFRGGSDSFYLRSTYTWRDTSFYLLYVRTRTEDFIDNGALDQEVNVVIGRNFFTHWNVTFKGGYGVQDVGNGRDRNQSDVRLFVSYSF